MDTNDTLNMVPLITTRDLKTNALVWDAVKAACDVEYATMTESMRDLSPVGHAAYWQAYHRHQKLLAIRQALTAELTMFHPTHPVV